MDAPNELEIEELGDEKALVLAQPHVTEELRAALSAAQIVFVPIKFRDLEGPLFPVGTSDVFADIQEDERLKELGVELASTDADYKELALHSEAVVQIVLWVASIGASALGSWLYDYVRRRRASQARIEFTVQRPNGKSTRLKYEGPADKLDVLRRAIEAAAADDQNPRLPDDLSNGTR